MRSDFSIITSFRFSLLSKSWPLRAVIATGVLLLVACGQAPPPYDIAINNGRVIDPESRLDAVRSIGIRAGKIEAISKSPIEAADVVDASGLVVSPGFINPVSYTHLTLPTKA